MQEPLPLAWSSLRRGVPVFLDEVPAAAADLSRRLWIASGTERLALEGQQGTKYEKGIFVPREDWRAPSGEERALLEGRGACNLAADIRVFAIPVWLHQFFWDLDPARLVAGPEFSAKVEDRLFNAFCAEAGAALGAAGIPSRRLNVRFQKARARSTTFDPEFGTFVGLHVDNFERRPIDLHDRSFPRLVVNLGLQSRSFVFINLPLIELLEPAGIPHSAETYRRYSWAYPLAHAFMAAQPDYPVLRLELRPGEGYCAPTQNLVHDGYTSESDGPDVVLSGFVKT
jgi:hypothetical protein